MVIISVVRHANSMHYKITEKEDYVISIDTRGGKRSIGSAAVSIKPRLLSLRKTLPGVLRDILAVAAG